MNKKGFVLAEAIVVAVFVLGMFTYLAMNIFPLITKYDQAINYDNPNEVYMANVLYDEILQTGKIDDLEEGMYSFKVDEGSNELLAYFNDVKIENDSTLKSAFFQNDYYKKLIYDGLGITNILVLKSEGEDESVISSSIKDNLTRGMRNYYNYLKGRKSLLGRKTSILLEFASKKFAYKGRFDIPYCFITTKVDNELTITDWEYKRDGCETVPSTIEIPSFIKTIDLPGINSGNVVEISGVTKDGVFEGALKSDNRTKIKDLTIPKSVKKISVDSFKNNPIQVLKIGYCEASTNCDSVSFGNKLSSLTVESGNIADNAFNGSPISNLTIGSEVEKIGDGAFLYADAVVYFVQSGESSSYSAVIHNKEKQEAIKNAIRADIASFNIVSSPPDDPIYSFPYVCNDTECARVENPVTKIRNLTLNDGKLTSIGDFAFRGVSLLTLTIPSSVTKIGDSAFANSNISDLTVAKCTSDSCHHKVFSNSKLNSVTVSSGQIGSSTFSDKSIVRLILKNGVSSIGNGAFSNNNISNAITLPESLSSLGTSVFYDNKISSLTIKSNLITTIPDYTFGTNMISGEVTFPNSVTTVGNYAFSNNRITKVNLSGSITTVGFYAFSNNRITEELTIPASMVSIGDGAFSGNVTTKLTIEKCKSNVCSNFGLPIKNLIINSGTIPDGAFSSKTSLTELTLNEGVTSIGNYAFGNCRITGNLVIPDTVSSIGNQAFQNNLITSVVLSKNLNTMYEKTFYGNDIKTITYNKCNTTICSGDGSYYGNKYFGNAMETVVIKSGQIGDYAFYAATELTNLTLGEGVTSIGKSAFASTAIKSVTIPKSVTKISDSAFHLSYISNLTFAKGITLKEISSYAFYGNDISKVVLPTSLIKIGPQAFNKNQLTSVEIPYNVTFIGNNAFTEQKDSSNKRTLASIILRRTRADFLNNVSIVKPWYDSSLNPTIICAGSPCTLS